MCAECGTELYSDPGSHEMGIYLHARKYACADGRWSYETGWPDWAGEEPKDLTDPSPVIAATEETP